jgi:hypothetical protein
MRSSRATLARWVPDEEGSSASNAARIAIKSDCKEGSPVVGRWPFAFLAAVRPVVERTALVAPDARRAEVREFKESTPLPYRNDVVDLFGRPSAPREHL